MKSKFILVLISVVLSISVYAEEPDKKEKVRKYLMETYAPKDSVIVGSTYFVEGTEIAKISTPFITKNSGIEVYYSTLNTIFTEYPVLKIAIAIDSTDNIKVLFSPTFTNNSDQFNIIFIGITAESNRQKKILTKEIGNIYKRITFKGKIKAYEKHKEQRKVDLYSDNKLIRQIIISFSDNKIDKAFVNSPYTE